MPLSHTIKFASLLSIGLLTACSMFTSHYDAKRYDNLVELKAIHIHLLENRKLTDDRLWNMEEIKQYCTTGELRFVYAHEYAKSLDSNDNTGQRAVVLLKKDFSNDCKNATTTLMNKIVLEDRFEQVEEIYTIALDGERSRN